MNEAGEIFASAAPYYARYRQPYDRRVFAAIAAELGLDADSTVLDLGTGTGGVALGLAPLVGRVVAADPSAGMLRQAREAPGAEAVRDSPFSRLDVLTFEHGDMTATLDQVVGAQFSYSFSSPARLGARHAAFEADLRAALLALEPAGRYPLGPVVTELVVAVRP